MAEGTLRQLRVTDVPVTELTQIESVGPHIDPNGFPA